MLRFLTACREACFVVTASEGYCRVSSHKTKDALSPSLTEAVYNVTAAYSLYKEHGNLATEQHCQVIFNSQLVH